MVFRFRNSERLCQIADLPCALNTYSSFGTVYVRMRGSERICQSPTRYRVLSVEILDKGV